MSATAEALICECADNGVRLTRRGDRLHVEATPGTVTPELREALTRAKPAILAVLSDCEGLPDEALRAYVRALRDTDLRQQGRRPDDETAPALCAHCGPVWIAPEIARIAPTVAGWPRVLGCPWCHVKDRQAIPRPEVQP